MQQQAVRERVLTTEDKIALLEQLPPEFWEFVDSVKEHLPQLIRLLKQLTENRGESDPPSPPISFGSGPPSDSPNAPQIYVERYDEDAPRLWFHSGVKTASWELLSAIARAG